MPRERAISTCIVTVKIKQLIRNQAFFFYPSTVQIIANKSSLFHIAVSQRAGKKCTKILVQCLADNSVFLGVSCLKRSEMLVSDAEQSGCGMSFFNPLKVKSA